MRYLIYIKGRCPYSGRRIPGLLEGFYSPEGKRSFAEGGVAPTVTDWRKAMRMNKEQAINECASLCYEGYDAEIEPLSESSEQTARRFTGDDSRYYMDT